MRDKPLIESMPRNQVNVWLVDLGAVPGGDPQLNSILSDDELERAQRFLRQEDTERFVAARASLRTVLGRYVGVEPSELGFGYGKFGKPYLEQKVAGETLCFNISHSQSWAAIAVCHQVSVGIDIEFGSRIDSPQSLAKVLLSPVESSLFHQLTCLNSDHGGSAGTNEFSAYRFVLNRWTLKEAYLKGVGEGLSRALSEIELREVEAKVPVSVPQNGDVSSVSLGNPAKFEVLCTGTVQNQWSLEQRSLGRDGSLAIAINLPAKSAEYLVKFHSFEL